MIQNTINTISFGPAVSPTDGVTEIASLASAMDDANTGVKISKNGGPFAARHAPVTPTIYDAKGNYLVVLDATDTNTLGSLVVQFTNAGTNCPIWQDIGITKDQQAQLDAIQTIAQALGAGATVVSVTSVHDEGRVVDLVAFDDYSDVAGQTIAFQSAVWPDMTGSGWDVVFSVYDSELQAIVVGLEAVSAEVVTYVDGVARVQIDLTSAQTGLLTPSTGKYTFNLQFQHTSLRMTPLIGELRVLQAFTPAA